MREALLFVIVVAMVATGLWLFVAGLFFENDIHGVAFLCGISTPSLSAQGEQRRSAFFNIRRDTAENALGFPVR
jgi:hypothetical protein